MVEMGFNIYDTSEKYEIAKAYYFYKSMVSK